MPTESLLSTLLAAAAFLKSALRGVATQAVRDAYELVKTYLKNELIAKPDAVQALEMAIAKPESVLRKGLLAEECAGLGLEQDMELVRLMKNLAAVLPASTASGGQIVRVSGTWNSVHVAGRDLIQTNKIVHRNTITPDERHLNVEQRENVLSAMRELAERLAETEGEPNFSAVHRMLQREFQIPSYLLIPKDRYEEVLSFLHQQRAIHRHRLRSRDPQAYRTDLYRAIFAGARKIGWDGKRVYQFATEKLGLKSPLASLKNLGPVQLKTLADFIQREVRLARSGKNSERVSPTG